MSIRFVVGATFFSPAFDSFFCSSTSSPTIDVDDADDLFDAGRRSARRGCRRIPRHDCPMYSQARFLSTLTSRSLSCKALPRSSIGIGVGSVCHQQVVTGVSDVSAAIESEKFCSKTDKNRPENLKCFRRNSKPTLRFVATETDAPWPKFVEDEETCLNLFWEKIYKNILLIKVHKNTLHGFFMAAIFNDRHIKS